MPESDFFHKITRSPIGDLVSVVTWGKYEAEGEKVPMPLIRSIHHAVADGFHLSLSFIKVQELINLLQGTFRG